MNMGEMVASVGASGAIFGLIGAMLWILIKNRGYQKEFYGGGVALMIAGSCIMAFLPWELTMQPYRGLHRGIFFCYLAVSARQGKMRVKVVPDLRPNPCG